MQKISETAEGLGKIYNRFMHQDLVMIFLETWMVGLSLFVIVAFGSMWMR
jgi:hypothetical protein